ncbi:hypothetical protein C7C46_30440, partial [Streptomyces tateyamensis]
MAGCATSQQAAPGAAPASAYAHPSGAPSIALKTGYADPATGTVKDFQLPLDAYRPTPAQKLTLDNARIALENSCLRSFGLSVQLPLKASEPDLSHLNAGLFGPTDEQAARAHGYRLPQSAAPAPAASPVNLPQDAQQLLTGSGPTEVGGKAVPQGGCLGQANRQLAQGGPPAPRDPNYANNLAASLGSTVDADPTVLAVQQKWSTCMKAAGFTFATSIDAMTNSWPGAAPSSTEIATATADVHCK